MRIELKIDPAGMRSVQQALSRLSGGELKAATAAALNDTGHHVRRAMSRELSTVFDRATPFVTRSPKFVPATPGQLSLRILPTLDARNLPSRGGKVGTDPQQVLQAQEFGGRRADKKSEVVLRRAGILPSGYQTAIPREPYPGSDDGRGNLRGAFVQQLLSYLQAFGEVGFKANMSAKRRARIEDRTTYSSLATKKTVKMIRGVVYFVSHGHLRNGRDRHLAPGIWAKTGTHGADIKPVLLFVRTPSYGPRLSMERIAQQSGAEAYLERRLRYRIRQLAEWGEASGVRL